MTRLIKFNNKNQEVRNKLSLFQWIQLITNNLLKTKVAQIMLIAPPIETRKKILICLPYSILLWCILQLLLISFHLNKETLFCNLILLVKNWLILAHNSLCKVFLEAIKNVELVFLREVFPTITLLQFNKLKI